MMSYLIIAVIIMASSGFAIDDRNLDTSKFKTYVMKNISSMSLAFTENQGQWDEQVLFRGNPCAANQKWSKTEML